MKALRNLQERSLLFLDIETVAGEETLTPDSPLYSAWEYKHRYNNELLRKSGDTLSLEDHFAEKSALYACFGKIVCITIGRIVSDKQGNHGIKLKSFASEDEYALLSQFLDLIYKICEADPETRIVGYNTSLFDLPFICKRAIVQRLEIPDILIEDGKPWENKNIDLGKLWKGQSIALDSLIAVCAALSVDSPKSNLSGSEVSKAYYEGRLPEIVSYCCDDVRATINVYRCMSLQDQLEVLPEKS